MPKKAQLPPKGGDDEKIGSMLDFLQQRSPPTGAKASPQGAPAASGAGGPDLAALQASIADLNARLTASERDRNALLTNAVTPETRPEPYKPVALDMSGLPDPLVDQPGYAKALNERIAKNVTDNFNGQRQWEAQQANQSGAMDGRLSALWEDFVSQHPEFEDHPDRIEFVAAQAVARAQQRGVDPQRYMLGSTSAFFNDVLDGYKRTFGDAPAGEGEGNSTTVETATPAATNRTAGIPGGIESGGSPSAGGEPDTGPSMADDLKAVQRTSGFF